MEKDTERTGALVSLVLKTNLVPNPGGSVKFKYVDPGHFAEKTISIVPVGAATVHADTGKFDIRFVIQRFGDLAHTFVLKYVPRSRTEVICWDSVELRSVTKLGRVLYCERLSRDANDALIHAYGWQGDTDFQTLTAVPLMFRETVDHKNTFLPLICQYGLVHDHETTTEVVIRGVDHVYGMHLDVDYVYLDTPARRNLAQHQLTDLHMTISDYVSQTFEIAEEKALLPLKVNLNACAEFNLLKNVTGLMITRAEGAIESFALDINGHRHSAWDSSDKVITWKKAGLKYGYCPFLPFSRDALKDPENAAGIDFSRIEKIHLYIWGNVTSVTVVALGHRTRYLSLGHVFIDTIL